MSVLKDCVTQTKAPSLKNYRNKNTWDVATNPPSLHCL